MLEYSRPFYSNATPTIPTAAATALSTTATAVGAAAPPDVDELTVPVGSVVALPVAPPVAVCNAAEYRLIHVGGAPVKLSTSDTSSPSASKDGAKYVASALSHAAASDARVGNGDIRAASSAL